MDAPRAALALALALAGGCDFSPLGSSSTSSGPTKFGFGAPTLEVTVGGVHFGPGAPASGSGATLVDAHDGTTGRVVQSTFRLTAANAQGGGCNLDLQREGDGIAPIGVGSYWLTGGGSGKSADGTVDPIEGESISIPQGTFTCAGSACGGAGFVLTAFDAAHVEGFLSGTFADVTGQAVENVTCAFYVPVLSLQP